MLTTLLGDMVASVGSGTSVMSTSGASSLNLFYRLNTFLGVIAADIDHELGDIIPELVLDNVGTLRILYIVISEFMTVVPSVKECVMTGVCD